LVVIVFCFAVFLFFLAFFEVVGTVRAQLDVSFVDLVKVLGVFDQVLSPVVYSLPGLLVCVVELRKLWKLGIRSLAENPLKWLKAT